MVVHPYLYPCLVYNSTSHTYLFTPPSHHKLSAPLPVAKKFPTSMDMDIDVIVVAPLPFFYPPFPPSPSPLPPPVPERLCKNCVYIQTAARCQRPVPGRPPPGCCCFGATMSPPLTPAPPPDPSPPAAAANGRGPKCENNVASMLTPGPSFMSRCACFCWCWC